MNNYSNTSGFTDLITNTQKRSNSLRIDHDREMLITKEISYLEDPENFPSSDSDSDYSVSDAGKLKELRRKNTYCGIEIKKQFGFM